MRDTRLVPRVHLRVLSDLHYAEPASRVLALGSVRPLLDGPERVILNGDSIDTRFVEASPRQADARDAFLAFVAPDRDRVTLITGNHDPNISEHHFLELGAGRILLTHGDVLFPSVAPWGWEAPHVLAARNDHLSRIPPEQHGRLETLLEVCKQASYATRLLSPNFRTGGGRLAHFRHVISRIRRADKILTSWLHAPSLAARLAAEFRPKVELVLFGHTHFPGLWRRSGRLIMNTGAFTPPFDARAIDFVDDRVEVRRIRRSGGEFRVGPVIVSLRPGRDFPHPYF